MLNVALTGNIAAGKSTVVSYFREWGATVIDSDELVRRLQQPGTDTFRRIVSRFGREILLDDGTIDRTALRRIVLANEEALASLNVLVHPAVARKRADLEESARASGDLILVNDIPLLFEVLDRDAFDLTILVDAPEEIRVRRLVETRGIPERDARRFLAHQMPSATKRKLADVIIENDRSLEDLESAAGGVWHDLRCRAALESLECSGPLLAVLAHPDDESFATGGTLARYRDAGIALHLICATRGEASRMKYQIEAISRVRTAELREASEILGIEDVVIGDFPDGGLNLLDTAGIRFVSDAVERVQPKRIITFGSDGITGHPDHVAVHGWVKAVSRRKNLEASLYYLAYPQPVAEALPRDLAWRPDREIAAELDVRPWRRDKLAAIAAHSSQEFPFPTDAPETQPLFRREWYARETPTDLRSFEIYA